jgi:hypothetical protein
MVTVTLTRYESIAKFRDTLKRVPDNKKTELREYLRVSNAFLKKISEAYSNYIMMSKMTVDRIVAKGSSLNSADMGALRTIKKTIEDRIWSID